MKTNFINTIFPVIAIAALSFGCEDPERGKNGPIAAPSLRFDSVGLVKTGSSTIYGNIINSGGLLTQGKGVLFSDTATTPSFKHQVKIATGDGAGVFSAALAGLKPRTNYRFRLFARNMVDTNYSEVYSFFSAPNLPSLSAAVVVDSSRWDSLVVSSSLITNGSESIFDRGFVIAKTNNPFINTKAGEINFVSVDSDSSLNGFQNTIRNLQPSTKYFIRPYARNRGGVGYGVQVAIRTKP
jgi:hypothetical protein